ncbi:5-formyltetrahydrofolate cyclo-ligase, partial [Lactobacillus sp. XV13L]|nr:5-formyltetrahydrofolate cyclo-ligase [Lactobacillus sp. XV13L]
MDDELPTQPIIQRALQLGKQVFVPKTYADYSMEFFNLDSQTKIQKTKFGVWEPAAVDPLSKSGADLTIVPALAIAADTHQRLGFGAGYYDRYLAAHPATTSVTLALPVVQLASATWHYQPWDYAIDYIITSE